jgi:hypothetical protein
MLLDVVEKPLAVARQLAFPPVVILAIRIEHALKWRFKARMIPMRENIVGSIGAFR